MSMKQTYWIGVVSLNVISVNLLSFNPFKPIFWKLDFEILFGSLQCNLKLIYWVERCWIGGSAFGIAAPPIGGSLPSDAIWKSYTKNEGKSIFHYQHPNFFSKYNFNICVVLCNAIDKYAKNENRSIKLRSTQTFLTNTPRNLWDACPSRFERAKPHNNLTSSSQLTKISKWWIFTRFHVN